MPQELQRHVDTNTVAVETLAAAVRADARWKKLVVVTVVLCTVVIVWIGLGNRDATKTVQECVPPPAGHDPGDCYVRAGKNQAKAIAQIRTSQRADLNAAVNQFIIAQGGEPVTIDWPDDTASEGTP